MTENIPKQQPFDNDMEPKKTKKPFFTPLTFGLGCGGLLIIILLAIVGFLYWVYVNLLVDQPLEFQMPTVSQKVFESAQAKIEKITTGDADEITLSEEEANAYIQNTFLPELIQGDKEKPGKGILIINADNSLQVKMSIPVSEKYLNIAYEGKAAVKQGKLVLDTTTKAVVGKFDDFSDQIPKLFSTFYNQEQFTTTLHSVTVENQQLHIKTAAKQPEAEGVPGDGKTPPADKAGAEPGGEKTSSDAPPAETGGGENGEPPAEEATTQDN